MRTKVSFSIRDQKTLMVEALPGQKDNIKTVKFGTSRVCITQKCNGAEMKVVPLRATCFASPRNT
jgi:hypothetical protein